MAMTLRLTAEDTEALRATAEREHRSMHEVAVEAISRYTKQRGERRDEALARIVSEDSGLLRRLAE